MCLNTYVIKRKPTTVRNPQANAILERVHQVIGQMLRTAELDMAKSVVPDGFLAVGVNHDTGERGRLSYVLWGEKYILPLKQRALLPPDAKRTARMCCCLDRI